MSTQPAPRIEGRSVLVTGGAGLVGRHLVDVLVPENDVRILNHFQTSDSLSLPQDVDTFVGDVRDAELVAAAIGGVDVVFHQAAMAGSAALEHPHESHDINTAPTPGLLEAARREDCRVVVASNAAIYGPQVSLPLTEDAPIRPLAPYGIQKIPGDLYARRYAELYGLETVVLRYFNVYGHHAERSKRKNVVNVFFERVRRGEVLLIVGDGIQTRDFVHVDDAGRRTSVRRVRHVGGPTTSRVGPKRASTSSPRPSGSVQERPLPESDHCPRESVAHWPPLAAWRPCRP